MNPHVRQRSAAIIPNKLEEAWIKRTLNKVQILSLMRNSDIEHLGLQPFPPAPR